MMRIRRLTKYGVPITNQYVWHLVLLSLFVLTSNLFLLVEGAWAESCWQKCDRKFKKWYQEPDRQRCKAGCEAVSARDAVTDALDIGMQVCLDTANDVTSRNQRSGRQLNELEKYYLRPHFGDLVDEVTIHWNAWLPDGKKIGGWQAAEKASAQTFGNHIYFEGTFPDSQDSLQLLDLAHELVHVEQYHRLGGLKQFCHDYAYGYTGKGGWDYYKNPLEKEAFDKAFQVAHWLNQWYDHNMAYYTYEHELPTNTRTVLIPHWLPIPDSEIKLVASSSDQAPAPVVITGRTSGEVEDMTEWMSSAAYQAEFDRQVSRRFYPKKVDAREYQGEIQLRATFAPYPGENFYFYSFTGMDDHVFIGKDAEYTANGFTLIWKQRLVTPSGRELYQATWSKE